MVEFREVSLYRAEAMMADCLRYDGRKTGATLAQLLAPGFFPSRARMPADTLVILFAVDGVALAIVAGHDGTLEKRPVLALLQCAAVSAPATLPLTNTSAAKRAA
jgi:hypothetical protein